MTRTPEITHLPARRYKIGTKLADVFVTAVLPRLVDFLRGR
jgi:hypothetical protein